MILWTLQPLSILEEIEKTGTFRCDRERSFNLSKKDSLAEKYQWLMERMERKIGTKPAGVEYPIWSWHTWKGERCCPDVNSAAFLKRSEDKVLLTLEIPENQVVLTDFDSWQTVLNGGYLTLETDEEKLEELEEFIDSLTEDELSEEIEKSWENVFRTDRIHVDGLQRGYFIQATFWELKKEYIKDYQIIKKATE